MTKIIDGKAISSDIRNEIKNDVQLLSEKGINIKLSIIIAGDDAASRVYLESKVKTLANAGITADVHEFSASCDTKELISLIKELNNDNTCDGIFIEQPLPSHIDGKQVILAIDPKKDVDGLHPFNLGALALGDEGFACCTPYGVLELLKRSNLEISGKHCVIAGRSNIVGKPMAFLMLNENATVTIAHSKTRDLKSVCRQADILILATGRAKMFNKDYIKQGAVVMDVGINTTKEGKLCGDADYEDIFPLCSAITPVPGGVGPMTVAILMQNLLKAARLNRGL